MSDDTASRYDPQIVEPRWIEVWANDVNTADRDSPAAKAGRTFTVMIPPPNVTGSLHMGHALNNTLQDILVRFHRMHGYEALWVPGTDHAGIATQAVVEKKLLVEQKLTREKMGREAFVAAVWDWKAQYGDRILYQLRRMGASVDWTRTKFTLDADLSLAVREAFVRLYEKGLVHRGARLVNWDCALRTAVSDDEIEYVAAKGKLWTIRYPAADGSPDFIEVATTRPETLLGDTGVAVNPDDDRWRHMIGRQVTVPFVNRAVPVVADETVERGFGTGAVKITPGHDPADYERGSRFRLPIISLLNKDGTLNENAAQFAGLSRDKARAAVVAALEEAGLLKGTLDIEHNVAVSDRSKTAIEPLVSEQWFVRMKPLAEPAIAAVKSGRLRFVPERWSKVYLDWLENVHDWCISRQLWWGHRIPVWYDEDDTPVASRTDLVIGEPHPVTGKPIVRQDPDVLDTWASSWLWPFATLGWPRKTEDLATFYPTQFLSTARDIMYLWVARMVMAGYEFLDHLPIEERCPFSVCYIHATVLDAQGRRMSKSLGNGIDPIDVIEQYGADAMRFTLAYVTTEGQDIKLDPKRFEMGRNFMNKLWNAARFMKTKALLDWKPTGETGQLRLEDRWIRAEFARTHTQVTTAIREYKFNQAAEGIYSFTWDTLCDWYLELVKPRLEDGADASEKEGARTTLLHVLTGVIELMHPITPHVTEELWEQLRPWHGAASHLSKSPWRSETFTDDDAVRSMDAVKSVIRAVRNLRKESGISDKDRVDVLVVPNADQAESARATVALREQGNQITRLALASSVRVDSGASAPAENASAVLPFATVYIDLAGKIDPAVERERLTKEIAKAEQSLAVSVNKLGNESFVARAKPDVVEAERTRMAETEERLARLRGLVARLQG